MSQGHTNKNVMGWMDISQPLTASIAHWPGDQPFSYELSYTKEETGSVNIGKMTTSLHTGTHADAPFHYTNDRDGIEALGLDLFIGPARVIDVTNYPYINKPVLSQFDLEGVRRLLLKTVPNQDPTQFPESITCLTEDGVNYLGEKGIFLVGVDVPSVDPLDSKDMLIHHALDRHRIHILENLVLSRLEPGDYELIALPLPIVGADGSPVRAVVRRN